MQRRGEAVTACCPRTPHRDPMRRGAACGVLRPPSRPRRRSDGEASDQPVLRALVTMTLDAWAPGGPPPAVWTPRPAGRDPCVTGREELAVPVTAAHVTLSPRSARFRNVTAHKTRFTPGTFNLHLRLGQAPAGHCRHGGVAAVCRQRDRGRVASGVVTDRSLVAGTWTLSLGCTVCGLQGGVCKKSGCGIDGVWG